MPFKNELIKKTVIEEVRKAGKEGRLMGHSWFGRMKHRARTISVPLSVIKSDMHPCSYSTMVQYDQETVIELDLGSPGCSLGHGLSAVKRDLEGQTGRIEFVAKADTTSRALTILVEETLGLSEIEATKVMQLNDNPIAQHNGRDRSEFRAYRVISYMESIPFDRPIVDFDGTPDQVITQIAEHAATGEKD